MTFIRFSGLVALLVAVTIAQQEHRHLPPVEHHVEEHHHAHPKYEFKYGVKDEHTQDIKEQHEKRDGHKVEGHYKLVEPDGTTRIVHYTADKHTGFHAHVERKGHAVHPIHHHHEVKHHEKPHHHTQQPKHHDTASSYSNVHHH